jgi:NAD(P)-dependent dehydrogenase (short-subunit alcohol dehydrogenase family)
MAEAQIIVTGGSRGIGAAIVSALHEKGFNVVSLSRSGTSPVGAAIACDVSDPASVAQAMAEAAARGPIRGLVNNAGAHTAAPSATLPLEAFEATMRLNATAVLSLSQRAYPHLAETGSSLIVNIGSFFDRLGVPRNLAYCASKAAVAAITRCLAVEWAKDGVRVLNVAPGYIETDLNSDFLARESTRAWLERRVPLGRAGRPEEVARLVAALFAEDIGFLTGSTIYLDGGQGMNH